MDKEWSQTSSQILLYTLCPRRYYVLKRYLKEQSQIEHMTCTMVRQPNKGWATFRTPRKIREATLIWKSVLHAPSLASVLIASAETAIFNLPTAQRAVTKQSKPVIYNSSKFIWLLLQWKLCGFQSWVALNISIKNCSQGSFSCLI